MGRKGNVLFFRDVGIQLNKERPINLSLELTAYNSAFKIVRYIYMHIFFLNLFQINRITNGFTTVNCYSQLLIKVSSVLYVFFISCGCCRLGTVTWQDSRPSAAERSRTFTNKTNRWKHVRKHVPLLISWLRGVKKKEKKPSNWNKIFNSRITVK